MLLTLTLMIPTTLGGIIRELEVEAIVDLLLIGGGGAGGVHEKEGRGEADLAGIYCILHTT